MKLKKLTSINEQGPPQEIDDPAEIYELVETENLDGYEERDDLPVEEAYDDSENLDKKDDFKDHQRHDRHHSFDDSDSEERNHLKKRNSGKRRHRPNQRDKWPAIGD